MKKVVIALATAGVLAMYTYASQPLVNGRPVAAIIRGPQSAMAEGAEDLTARVRACQEENARVTGWLKVPDTKIDYPIVHDPTLTHNGFYTLHDAYGNPDPNGTYFADRRSTFGQGHSADLQKLTVLYGHSFSDDSSGTLMDSLKRYRDIEYARRHPYIYFSTWEENMVFEVVAVFDAHINMPYNRYDLPDDQYARMLADVLDLSYYDYAVKPGVQDNLMVISCCTYSVLGHPQLPANTDYRYAVMGRLVPAASAGKTQAELALNTDRAAPDQYKDWF